MDSSGLQLFLRHLYHKAWTDETFRKGMYSLYQVWKTWNTRRRRIKAVPPLPKVLLEKLI